MNKEESFVLWLCSLEGLGRVSRFRLWREMGEKPDFARRLYEEPWEKVRRSFAGTGAENPKAELFYGKVQGILERGRREKNPQSLREKLERERIFFTWAGAADFPERLRHIADPPFQLYFRGRLPQEEKISVGIVGARMASAYGREQARRFAGGLAAKGAQIISGMAFGVDGIAGRGALEVSDASYAVLGCGVDICYPEENRDLYRELARRGGVISEYRPGTTPEARLFPPRNRLISAFSDALLVVEAREKSGTLITVDCALEQGKDVYAVPGRVCDRGSSGCNELIRQGAGIAVSPELLWEELSGEEISGEELSKEKLLEERCSEGKFLEEKSSVERISGENLLGKKCRESQRKQPAVTEIFPEGKETREKTAGTSFSKLERSILGALDSSTPRGIAELLPRVQRDLGRECSFPEVLRTLMKLAAAGYVKEIRVGKYISR